jgi:hypothetical protein
MGSRTSGRKSRSLPLPSMTRWHGKPRHKRPDGMDSHEWQDTCFVKVLAFIDRAKARRRPPVGQSGIWLVSLSGPSLKSAQNLLASLLRAYPKRGLTLWRRSHFHWF